MMEPDTGQISFDDNLGTILWNEFRALAMIDGQRIAQWHEVPPGMKAMFRRLARMEFDGIKRVIPDADAALSKLQYEYAELRRSVNASSVEHERVVSSLNAQIKVATERADSMTLKARENGGEIIRLMEEARILRTKMDRLNKRLKRKPA